MEAVIGVGGATIQRIDHGDPVIAGVIGGGGSLPQRVDRGDRPSRLIVNKTGPLIEGIDPRDDSSGGVIDRRRDAAQRVGGARPATLSIVRVSRALRCRIDDRDKVFAAA